MTIEEKYQGWKEIFYKYFIFKSDNNEKGSNIPLSYVNLDNKTGISYDGTICLSYYLQYAYTLLLLNEDNGQELANGLLTLQRLCNTPYNVFSEEYPKVFFNKEPGFFLRDDISVDDASKFNLTSVSTSYTRGIELVNEDPCESAYVSQDQIWNLIPILHTLASNGYPLAKTLGYNILNFVVKNKHRIYNPYYSALYHLWTYVPTFNTNKVPYSDRVQDRNNHLKYKIRVKRGSYNWYFSYGFKKAYNKFGGDSKTFWSSLWYKPFIFLADRVWEPIVSLFGGSVKNNSYYCLGVGADAWYCGSCDKRLINRFNDSLYYNVLDEEDLFMPHLAFLTDKVDKIDYLSLEEWLERYPEPIEKGEIGSPIIFMILYNWYKIYKSK